MEKLKDTEWQKLKQNTKPKAKNNEKSAHKWAGFFMQKIRGNRGKNGSIGVNLGVKQEKYNSIGNF